MNRLWLIPILTAMDLIGFGMLIPDIQLRAESLGMSGAMIGAALSSMFVVQTLMGPVWGRISHRVSPLILFVVCTSLSGLAMGAYAFATMPLLIFGSRILAGLGGANVAMAQAIVSHQPDPTFRAAALGRIGGANLAGLTIGSAISGWISGLGGQMALGMTGAALSLTAALIALIVFRATGPEDKPESEAKRKVKLSEGYWRLAALAIVAWFSLALLEGTFGRLIKQTLGFGSKEFGIIFAYESVLGFLTQSFFFAKIQARFGSRKTEFVGLVLMGLGLAATPLAISFAWLIVCSTAYALGSGVAFPAINADVADRVDESQRTEAYSLLQGARSFGFFVGPVLGGILFDINIRAPYFFAGSVCLVAGLGALLLAHQRTASA